MKNLNLLNIKQFLLTKKNEIIFIGLILFSSVMLGLYQYKSNELKLAELNIKTQNDTIKVLKNKNNENVYKINSLILDKKQLKESNNILNQEIEKLNKKDKKNLVEINKLNLTINLLNDSIKNLNNKLVGSVFDQTTGLTTYNFELKDSTEFRELRGLIKVTSKNQPYKVNTILTKDMFKTDLTIGKTLKNDKLELFVSSSNSGLVVTNLVGSVIDLKAYNKLQPKKRFSLGIQIGYGATIYGLSPYIGIGASYNLINF